MENENAFLQKLDKIGNLTQVVCLSLFLTGVSVQGVSAETGFPISQSVQQTKTVTYNPQIQISAESETKRSIFREKDKTKRSKKESAQHSKSRNKSFVMTSVSAL